MGGHFINENDIDWSYLEDILSCANITIQKKERNINTGVSVVHRYILTITMKRPKKLDMNEGCILQKSI